MIRVDLKQSTKARKAHSRLEIQNLIFEIRLFASLSDFARHVSILHRYVLTPILHSPDYVKTGSRRQTILKICFDIKLR